MDTRFSALFPDPADPQFSQKFTDVENDIFKVVFYPDRIYHATYFNATRSPRYRYNVTEVRNAFDITVLKAEVYLDGVFLSNVLRVEYRGARLTEVAREKNRFLRDQIMTHAHLLDPKAPADAPNQGPTAELYLHFDKWINAYQTEIWESVAPPPRKYHDFKVLDQIGRMGSITSVFAFKELIRNLPSLRQLELSFRENDIDLPFGYRIQDPQWDNDYTRNHQAPVSPIPSDNAKNTIEDDSYLIDFQRGHFFDEVDTMQPVRYLNAMMETDIRNNTEIKNNNIVEMRWILQREFASSVVFFHKVTIPPGATEGTHRHIGTEELYCIVEGEGTAYMGDGDDPSTDKYPLVNRYIYGYGIDAKPCRELPVKPGTVIYTKSGGIHGIQNKSADKPLRFVAFLYHTS
jgi:oxalate decarboxylase/phosphoglucose isomerase-like protein (cupin superfamily)